MKYILKFSVSRKVRAWQGIRYHPSLTHNSTSAIEKRNKMNATQTINGVTLNQITRMMISSERIISWYNKKYNFDVPTSEKQYFSTLKQWDFLKSKRDLLKATA